MATVENITDEDVARLQDMVAARKQLKKLGLSTKNINSVDAAKEALRSHIHRDRTGGLRKPDLGIENGIVARIVKTDQRKRNTLLKILADLRRLLSKYPSFNMAHLKRAFPNLERNLDRIESKLIREDCAVLVAGETSAGKSTFLNLLLGETEQDLLPVAHLSCSSVITELKYGERRYARAHPWPDVPNGRMRELDLSGDNASEILSDYIYQKGRRKQRFEWKRVEIFWPCDWLKTGVTIVDTPGVGENAQMTQLVKEYMPKAVGFIYIVNSTNAGGIQPDRLQDLLFSQVLEAKISEEEDWPLDPNSVVFICNKWDEIPLTEHEDVKQYTYEKLHECWTPFKKSQTFFLSAKDAREALQHGFETEEYKSVMEGMGRLLPAGMTQRLSRHYWYISQVLQKAENNLKTVMSQVDLDEDDRIQILEHGLEKLEQLKRRPEEVLDLLRDKVKTEVEKGMFQIREHFTKQITISRVCEFRESECPDADDLSNLEEALDMVAVARIRRDINMWESRNNIFQSIQDNVLCFLKDKFLSLKKDLDLIEHHFASGSFALENDMRKVSTASAMSSSDKVHLPGGSTVWAPLGVVVSIFSRPAMGLRKALEKRKYKKFLDRYDKNKTNYLAEVTRIHLETIMGSGGGLQELLEAKINEVFRIYEKMIERMPVIIQADKNMLEEMKKDIRSQRSTVEELDKLSAETDSLFGKLCLFNINHIKVYDIDVNDLTGWSVKDNPVAEGQYGKVLRATLVTPQQKIQVALKIQKSGLTESRAADFIKEEECLRKLQKPYIVHYMGTSLSKSANKDRPTPIMVMEYCPTNLETIIYNTTKYSAPYRVDDQDRGEDMRPAAKYAFQIASGLQNIHSLGYVHRDLKPANILVTQKGEIRLADMGISKKESHITGTVSGTPLYMAPEVMNEMKYNRSADMFSYGLILWELWYGTCVYPAYKVENLKGFLRAAFSKERAPDDMWKGYINRCLSVDPRVRPCSHDCACYFEDFGKTLKLTYQ